MVVFCVVLITAATFLVFNSWHVGIRLLCATAMGGVCIAIALSTPVETSRSEASSGIPRAVKSRGFTSSSTCRKCHPGQFETWHETYHRTMTQKVSPETVRAPFAGVEQELDRERYRFHRKGDEFFVDMPDPTTVPMKAPEPPRRSKTYRVVMMTGSHHVQVYWVDVGDHLREVPIYWHIDGQRWIPKNDTTLVPPDRQTFSQIWNVKCIRCHSVGGNPNVHPTTRKLSSKVAEFGISCEACHGPAEEHIRLFENPMSRFKSRSGEGVDTAIVNPAKQSPKVSSEICGQCHTEFDPIDEKAFIHFGLPYRSGGDLTASHRMFDFDFVNKQAAKGNNADFYRQHGYWADGTSRSGGDEYLGLIASRCFIDGKGERQLSCLSCHQMHGSDPNDQLKAGLRSDKACLQCHESFADDIEAHTHHPAESSGSRCYNCHMPNTTYALFTAMRSHRVDSPDIGLTAKSGRPNACNLCHTDKTMAWSTAKLTEWFDAPPAELTPLQRELPAGVFWALTGDAAQRLITAWHLGWPESQQATGKNWQAPILAELLTDRYSVVRHVAGQSTKTLPGFDNFEFDFIGSIEHRQQSAKAVQDKWKLQQQPNSETPEGFESLFAPGGGINRKRFDELIKRRDSRDVYLPE